MKKFLSSILIVACGVLLIAARADALTAPESMEKFVAAAQRFLDNINRSAPWDKIGEDDALPLDPVAFVLDGGFRPLLNLGVSKDSMEREKDSFGWESVTYEEQGNEFRIVCEYRSGASRDIFKGLYDPATDRLLAHRVSIDTKTGKVWGETEFEYMKTSFGYVARIVSFENGEFQTVHKLAIKGGEGIVSWGETKFDTLSPSMDFPKEGRAWYEIKGDRFIFQPWDGPAREYKIKARKSAAADNEIVGTWEHVENGEAAATLVFTTDSQYSMQEYRAVEKGTYKVKGNKLTVHSETGHVREIDFKLEGGKLIMAFYGGTPVEFVKK